jgi:predicted DNA-binding protein with PD1-like motif
MRIFFSILLFIVTTEASAQSRYTKTPTGYLMVLRQGDSIIQHLEKFAIAENIPSANFTGMGFVNVTFGFFDAETKQYNPKDFRDVEMSGMLGSIAWQKGKPSIHTHGIVTGRDFVAHGGHILSGTVGTGSLEIAITVHDKRLERERDEELGANVLSVE